MIQIYQLDSNNIYTGHSEESSKKDGIGRFWTRVAPPELQDGEYAHFDGVNWSILDRYPDIKKTPHPIDMRQFRLELNSLGLLDAFETAVNEANDNVLKIEWEYASTVSFNGPFRELIISVLDTDSDGYHQFFISASQR